MSTKKWNAKKVEYIAKKVLPKYDTVQEAVDEIANYLEYDVTLDCISSAFRRYHHKTPGAYLKVPYDKSKSRAITAERKLMSLHEFRSDMVSDIMDAFAKLAPIKVSKLKKPKPQPHGKNARENCALLSDLHFGLRIDKEEMALGVGYINEYNWEIGAKRLGKFTDQIASYKHEHRGECNQLRLCLGGDLGQGLIHADTDSGTDLIVYQVAGISYYLIQMIDYLRHYYNKVVVECTPDNHLRMMHKGPSRAFSQKFDSFATIIHMLVQAAFINIDDVEVNITKSPISTFNVLGHKFALTHGDTHIQVGNVGKHVDIGKIVNQAIRLNAGVADGKPYRAILLAHVHVPLYIPLPDTNTLLVTNGTGSGTDGYAYGSGYFTSAPAQVMWESTEAYPIGDFRVVTLGDADQKSEYAKIIYPYDYGLEVSKMLGIVGKR